MIPSEVKLVTFSPQYCLSPFPPSPHPGIVGLLFVRSMYLGEIDESR